MYYLGTPFKGHLVIYYAHCLIRTTAWATDRLAASVYTSSHTPPRRAQNTKAYKPSFWCSTIQRTIPN